MFSAVHGLVIRCELLERSLPVVSCKISCLIRVLISEITHNGTPFKYINVSYHIGKILFGFLFLCNSQLYEVLVSVRTRLKAVVNPERCNGNESRNWAGGVRIHNL